jgi:hypothetical protein
VVCVPEVSTVADGVPETVETPFTLIGEDALTETDVACGDALVD